jgi:FKBP-type peptidyl-prolyl cis-trans isomerase 2
VVEPSEESKPITFIQDDGEILLALEEALHGMAVGEEKEVWLAPEEALGPRRADADQVVLRGEFPKSLPPAPGVGLYVHTETGEAFPAYVAEVRPDTVALDFNHPLAGEALRFTVKILPCA